MMPFPADSFTKALAKLELPGMMNPWGSNVPGGEERRLRLAKHLRCPMPRFLFVSQKSLRTDALATGLPLCCELTSQRFQPELVSSKPGSVPAVDPDALSLWTAVDTLGIKNETLCFTAFPLCASAESWRSVRNPREVLLQETRWVRRLIGWHPGLQVIALGSAALSQLRNAGIPCNSLSKPAAPEFESSLREFVGKAALTTDPRP